MSDYRRVRVAGGTYFFTVCIAARGSSLLTDRVVDLRAAYAATVRDRPLICEAMVVLPDHLHAVWTLPAGDADYATRWMLLKRRFAYAVAAGPRTTSKRRRREKGVWQRRYWEHRVRDEDDLVRCVRYVRENPVRHGYVERAEDWPFVGGRRVGITMPTDGATGGVFGG